MEDFEIQNDEALRIAELARKEVYDWPPTEYDTGSDYHSDF